MAAATTPAAALVPRISSSTATPRRTNANRVYFGVKKVALETACLARASKSQREEAKSDNDDPAFLAQEDMNYLVKLGAGSVVGSAAIKYGSIIFPDITRPNITQALLTIFFPVTVAVLLLIRQSRSR